MKRPLLLAMTALSQLFPAYGQTLTMHIDFTQVDGADVTCSAGSGVTAKVMSSASIVDFGEVKALYLGDGTGYLDLTSAAGALLKASDDYTLSMYYYVSAEATISDAGNFLWTFSTSAACTASAGKYSAYRLNAQRYATSTGGYNNESAIEVGTASAQGVWKHVLYTEKSGTGTLYIDGEAIGSASMTKNSVNYTTAPSYCWIGRSPYSGDSYLKKTYVADIRYYNGALGSADIAALASYTDELQEAMDYGSSGDSTALLAAIAEGETFLSSLSSSSDYPLDAITTFEDVLTAARAIAAAGAGQSLLESWTLTVTTALATLKSAEGYSFVEPAADDSYSLDRGFRHPGCINSQEEFDRVKALLAAGDDTITAAYSNLVSNAYSSSSLTPNATESIIRGGSSGENYINAARQAHGAYMNALLWRLTGSTAHADCAVNILNAWAATCKTIGGDSNYALASGIYGYEFANAAELMRDYEGWEEDDFETYKQWMLNVWYRKAIDFLRERNGTWENASKWWTAPGHYWSNWGLCNVLCVLSIGVLCDDPFIYNQALSFYKYDQCGTFQDLTPSEVAAGDGYIWSWGLTEFLGNLVPIVSDTPDSLESTPWGKLSQMQESGRDQGHCTLSIGFAADICQTALNQGDDLWAYMDNRLAGGIEHMAAYNYAGKDDLPFVKYIRQSNGYTVADGRGGIMTQDSEASRGQVRAYWDRVLGYYEGRKGVKMPYAEKACEEMGIDGGGGGSTSGGYDHLGYSTLMCHVPMVSSDSACLTLVPTITYNNKVYEHNELGGLTNTYTVNTSTGVTPGSALTLTAEVPEGADAGGQWLWDSGETGNSITVTADESRMYRVVYTAPNGVESSQNFVIAVSGDCQPTALTTTITSDDADISGDSAVVFYGNRVTMTIDGAGGWGDAYWSDGTTSATLTLPALTSPRTLTGVFINQGGRRQKASFYLAVKYMRPDIIVDGALMKDTARIIIDSGDSVVLRPWVPSVIRSRAAYLWDDGTTTRTLDLGSVTTSSQRTFTVTYGDYTESVTYRILVRDEEETPLADGNYTIRYIYDDTYLTDNGLNTQATFEPFEGADNQKWYIEGGTNARYNFISLSDSLMLLGTGKMAKKSYHPLRLSHAVGTDYYAIHTATPKYMSVSADGTVDISRTSLTDYPFGILPLEDTDGIRFQRADDSGSDDVLFDLTGRRAGAPTRPGLYITSDGKKILR